MLEVIGCHSIPSTADQLSERAVHPDIRMTTLGIIAPETTLNYIVDSVSQGSLLSMLEVVYATSYNFWPECAL